MFHTIPAYYIRAVNPVFVGISRTHQAVGGHQDTAWNVVKLFLLILPGSTEVTYKMRIFFQSIITVAGQHFTMGIDVDAGAFRLLQQHFQII